MQYVRSRLENSPTEPSGWADSGLLLGIVGEINLTDEQIELFKDTNLANLRSIRFLQEGGEIIIDLA